MGAIVWFVLYNPHTKTPGEQSALGAISSSADKAAAVPLDQLSSADIAETVARLTNLPEVTAIANQAQSENAELTISQTSDSLVVKPQVVATAFKSNKDIKIYTAKLGDTISDLASRFNITSDSIRWSNSNFSGSSVPAGTKLYIPPVNGIVYTVKSGDTPASIARAYRASQEQIIAYNDAELTGLRVGSRILIPNGQRPAPVYTYFAQYSGNGYDFGFCTWYVATQIAVPSNWGNAATWAYYAGLSGWTVSSVPRVGAIAQTPYSAGGLGHVAVVTEVSPDGKQIKYRDMNGVAGWNRVGYSDWVPTSRYLHYIYH